ncbi:hypothetical protein MTO96_044695 [Rhipicephalus appendiculatus]
MTVATISWDVSALTDSGMAPVESHKSLFGAASALHTLLTVKVPRKDCAPRVPSRIALSSGPQAALKAYLTGAMGNLRLGSQGNRGRERCEGHSLTGAFDAASVDASLLTINAPLRMLRSAGVAFWVTMLPNGPQAGKNSLSGTVAHPCSRLTSSRATRSSSCAR